MVGKVDAGGGVPVGEEGLVVDAGGGVPVGKEFLVVDAGGGVPVGEEVVGFLVDAGGGVPVGGGDISIGANLINTTHQQYLFQNTQWSTNDTIEVGGMDD